MDMLLSMPLCRLNMYPFSENPGGTGKVGLVVTLCPGARRVPGSIHLVSEVVSSPGASRIIGATPKMSSTTKSL